MTRVCTVCSHPERAEIDRQLLSGASYRKIAEQFHVTAQAQLRHKADHLLAELVKAKQAEDVSRATDLLAMATTRDKLALALLAKAERTGDLKTAVQALRVSLVSLELLARLRGELNEQQNTINILVAPEWLSTRAALMRALEPYVEARIAVSAALLAVEEAQHSHLPHG
jgi:hypothetical protein